MLKSEIFPMKLITDSQKKHIFVRKSLPIVYNPFIGMNQTQFGLVLNCGVRVFFNIKFHVTY
jgi:hypothetical protein